MIKNICIIIGASIMMSSCTMSFSAVTPTQKYSGSVTIYDVHGDDYEIREVEAWKK
jgi:hypothetical protein